MNHDWKLHVSNDFMLDRDIVIFYLPRPDGRTEFLKMINVDGTTEVEVAERGTQPDMKGFALPNGLLEAIAEHVKPGPNQGEIGRLEAALATEQNRVDRVLDNFVTETIQQIRDAEVRAGVRRPPTEDEIASRQS